MDNGSHKKKPIEQRARDFGFVARFVVFGTVMALANAVPWLLTRGSQQTDGTEIAGWPLRCYECSNFFCFYPWMMVANIVIAVVVAAGMAWLFRDGVWFTIRRWKNWGTPFAE